MSKKSPAPTRSRKRGPPSTAEVVARATDRDLTEQMQRAAVAVFRRIERLTDADQEIPSPLLGAARIMAEWHTDFETVKSAMPDLAEGEDR